MAFNGTEGSPISLPDAAQLTTSFQTEYPDQPRAFFVGRDWIEQLLKDPEAMGIRIYNGLNKEEKMEPVIVAAKVNEDDMLELIIDNTFACPPRCSINNPLNP